MNTAQLTCFLTIAETLNFAQAAQQLNITQPAVTRQIQALEEELNEKLFNRTTRNVELTHSGVMFINDAKNILSIMERAKKRAKNSFEDTRKPFIIGCHVHNELFQFTDVLRKMKESYPDIYPYFKVIPFQHLYQYLEEGSVDLIASFEETALRKNILYQEIEKIRLVAVPGQSSPLFQKQELTTADLEQEKLILMEPRKCSSNLSKAQDEIIKGRFLTDIYLCDSIAACVTLAYAGFGTAVVPDIFFKKEKSFSYIPIKDIEQLSYGIYYRQQHFCPEIKSFIKYSKEYFSTSL